MKPIENTTGVERAVSALLGKTAETLTTTLAAKIMSRPRPAQRRRARPRPAAPRDQRAALVKGGGRHG